MSNLYKPDPYTVLTGLSAIALSSYLLYANFACFTILPRVSLSLSIMFTAFLYTSILSQWELQKSVSTEKKEQDMNYRTVCCIALFCAAPIIVHSIVFGFASYAGISGSFGAFCALYVTSNLLSYVFCSIAHGLSSSKEDKILDTSMQQIALFCNKGLRRSLLHMLTSVSCAIVLGYGLGGFVSYCGASYIGEGIATCFTSYGVQEVLAAGLAIQ